MAFEISLSWRQDIIDGLIKENPDATIRDYLDILGDMAAVIPAASPRRCSGCSQEKTTDDFWKDKRFDRYIRRCRTCEAARQRRQRLNTKKHHTYGEQ